MGAKVIFNSEYIDELTRRRDTARARWETENMTQPKNKLYETYQAWDRKLEEALDFQDTIESVVNTEYLNVPLCKTISGKEIPMDLLQTI